MRKIQTVIADSVKDQVLQLIDYSKQVFTEGRHFAVLVIVERLCSRAREKKLSVVDASRSTPWDRRFFSTAKERWRVVTL